ncbi:branched chain amino acid aminotransferase [Adhaeribacter aerolatus]|uniref:Branched chain amino acid aminotransferase n=1 Tax=Adhaeribacter aerolatus TaxID=670289 RepID=A0A512B0U7_9BACT|nr:HAD family hydrolase [Adhaeribacter aerolatus]GEO05572.1 branched chain amino acid aminotransferase [Adhaeribacter aerolatus]
MVIHLISGPRNISTALMYSFAQRPDTQVLDEPFYGFYLQHTGLHHPGRDEIMNTLEPDPAKIFALIAQAGQEKEQVFVKNMGHHLQGFNFDLIKSYRNIFLIREPGQMLISYAKVRESPTLADIGLKHQQEIFSWLEKEGCQPLVVDGDDIRQNPAAVLSRLCQALEIPFTEAMLTWPAGTRPEDGIWAKYWYNNVHQSTGFVAPTENTAEVPAHLQDVYESALPYYKILKQKAITA